MRAFVLDSFDSAPAVRDDLPAPTPADGEVLIRVHASSVNPVDVHIAAGALRGMLDYEFPTVIGRDFAGVVVEVGSRVRLYRPGDEVFGFLPHANPTVHDGSWAELICTREDDFVARRPQTVDVPVAGAAPLAGITALAAADALELAAGERVLVIGATGGVGSIFVQLAAAAGAAVIAPALSEDREYLRGLGVAEIVDRGSDLASALREAHPDGVDAILDLVSFTPDQSMLATDGRVASPLGAAGDGPRRFNLMARSTPENLQRLAALIDDGTVRVPVQRTYPLEQAAAAMQAQQTRHLQGKLGLTLD
jgi:NADPH2:quinone reductase